MYITKETLRAFVSERKEIVINDKPWPPEVVHITMVYYDNDYRNVCKDCVVGNRTPRKSHEVTTREAFYFLTQARMDQFFCHTCGDLIADITDEDHCPGCATRDDQSTSSADMEFEDDDRIQIQVNIGPDVPMPVMRFDQILNEYVNMGNH